jgi:hypothetical protein
MPCQRLACVRRRAGGGEGIPSRWKEACQQAVPGIRRARTRQNAFVSCGPVQGCRSSPRSALVACRGRGGLKVWGLTPADRRVRLIFARGLSGGRGIRLRRRHKGTGNTGNTGAVIGGCGLEGPGTEAGTKREQREQTHSLSLSPLPELGGQAPDLSAPKPWGRSWVHLVRKCGDKFTARPPYRPRRCRRLHSGHQLLRAGAAPWSRSWPSRRRRELARTLVEGPGRRVRELCRTWRLGRRRRRELVLRLARGPGRRRRRELVLRLAEVLAAAVAASWCCAWPRSWAAAAASWCCAWPRSWPPPSPRAGAAPGRGPGRRRRRELVLRLAEVLAAAAPPGAGRRGPGRRRRELVAAPGRGPWPPRRRELVLRLAEVLAAAVAASWCCAWPRPWPPPAASWCAPGRGLGRRRRERLAEAWPPPSPRAGAAPGRGPGRRRRRELVLHLALWLTE